VQSLEWRIGEFVEENKSVMESHASREQDFKESFFSWDKHGFTPDSTHFIDIDSLNNELREKVSALSVDNESLQGLLEQQRNLRVAAETELQKLQQKVAHTDAETQFYAEENNSFKEQLQVEIQQKTLEELKGECGRLEEKNNNLQYAYHALKTVHDRMCTESEECVLATERKCEALQCEYTKKIEDICNKKDKIEEYYRNVLGERDQLAEDVQKLSKNLAGLTQQHETLKSEYSILREHTVMHEKTLALAGEQKGDLEQELALLKSETESMSLRLSDTPGLLSEQKMRIAELEMELQTKTEEIERLRQLIESQKLDQAEVEQEWNGRVERLRKELELSAEDLYKQQDRYSMLMKEHQELQDHNSEIIQCHVQETVHAKEQEIEGIKAQLMEKETRFVMEIEERPKEDPKYKFDETSDLLTARDRDIEILNIRLTQKEKEIEEIFSVKDKDIQNLKIMLSENERKFEELLGQKDQDIYNLRVLLADNDAKISELQQTLDEEARQLTELRELLEDRELQLRQLKDELLITKHNEAQALSVLPKQPHDSFSSSLTDKNQSSVEHHVDRRGRKDSSASETQQGELDLALYMLHQRDVRCDELTLELMQVRILIKQLEI
jgi:chromosome segregation ATPase